LDIDLITVWRWCAIDLGIRHWLYRSY